MQKLKKFMSLNQKDMLILIEAFILSGLYRLMILVVPFKTYKKHMGTYNAESNENIDINFLSTIKKVSWAVNMTGKYSPWESKCLVRALVAQKMLKRRSLDCTLYLGVKREKGNKVQAHAWLRCGKVIVTGGKSMPGFTEVAKFSICKEAKS